MELTEYDKQGIAELRTLPAYMKLMGVLKDYEDDVLFNLANTMDSATTLRHARFYQFLNATRGVLQSVPDAIQSELDRLRDIGTPDSQMSLDEIWKQRFNGEAA